MMQAVDGGEQERENAYFITVVEDDSEDDREKILFILFRFGGCVYKEIHYLFSEVQLFMRDMQSSETWE